MKMFKNRKGFTLIEIMIVVIILAIMATLILPKMLAAPESAYLAEANSMLGALARAQDTYMQLSGSSTGLVVDATSTTWGKLGMTMPSGGRYTYTCTSSTCVATRSGVASNTVTYDYVGRTFTACGGNLQLATKAERGCIIA